MKNIIPTEMLQTTCKIGQGKACCRYIVAGADGIECAKHTPLRVDIDQFVALGRFTAQGDNCEGLNYD